ncbi:MAG TPA: BadF/BadG/BcrA/BcrD ATPase family protein [Methylomirabilota bacterium]|nr:BadF/BadG/BcrA/BcrD ATPase family protein [Methylomirabilota bacterium]
MSGARQRSRPPAVGIDLGGTWVRAVVLRDGRVTRRRERTTGLPELSKFLPRLWGGTRHRGPLVVAARGVWTLAERRTLRRRLRRLAARVHVISDVEAALLGALGGRPGVLVLAGTGSIVLGRDGRGRLARAGGLGPLLGDEGSAFWLGREWLRLRPDAAGRARALGRRADAVARVAALAPGVLAQARRGDRRARAIVAAGQEHLAAHAAQVIRRLRLGEPVHVSWGGGLLADDRYRAGVRRALARRARCRWQPPAADAALAAARLAAGLQSRAAGTTVPGSRRPAGGRRGERRRSPRR